jgi:glycosyltransferase involved in cell wall biosynthesis
MTPKLSILTPTIPGREKQLERLTDRLAAQIGDSPVEHLVLCDNKRRSIGGKRQALLDIARGEYIAFVDDDDTVAEGYVSSLLTAIEKGADVITFRQRAIYNGLESTVVFGINNRDEAFNPGGTTFRAPWHVCAWRRDRVADCQFAETNYGEDRIWAMQARRRARTGYHIDRVLHTYIHDAKTTAAPENVRDPRSAPSTNSAVGRKQPNEN